MGVGGEQQDNRRGFQVAQNCPECLHGGIIQPLGVIYRQRHGLLLAGGAKDFAQGPSPGKRRAIAGEVGESVGPLRKPVGEYGQSPSGRCGQSLGLEQTAPGEPTNAAPLFFVISFDRTHRGYGDAIEPQPPEQLLHQPGLPHSAFPFEDQGARTSLGARGGGSIGEA